MSKQQYTSKYNNVVRDFFQELDPNATLQEISKRIGVTYASLHYSYKVGKITQALFVKVIKAYNLSDEKKSELRNLLAPL